MNDQSTNPSRARIIKPAPSKSKSMSTSKSTSKNSSKDPYKGNTKGSRSQGTQPHGRKPAPKKPAKPMDDMTIERTMHTLQKLRGYRASFKVSHPETIVASFGELLYGFCGITFNAKSAKTVTLSFDASKWSIRQRAYNDGWNEGLYFTSLLHENNEWVCSVLSSRVLDMGQMDKDDFLTDLPCISFWLHHKGGFNFVFTGSYTNKKLEEKTYAIIVNNQHKSPGFFRTVGAARILGHGGLIDFTSYLTKEHDVLMLKLPKWFIEQKEVYVKLHCSLVEEHFTDLKVLADILKYCPSKDMPPKEDIRAVI